MLSSRWGRPSLIAHRVARAVARPRLPQNVGAVFPHYALQKLVHSVTGAAIRSSPVSMVGDSCLGIEGRVLPLNGAHVSHEQVNFRWPLPYVAGSPDRRVLSGLPSGHQSSLLGRLVGPYKLRLNLAALPCSVKPFGCMPAVRTPEAPQSYSPFRALGFRLTRSGIGSAAPITIDFGAILPFPDVAACNLLSTLRSGRHRTPRQTRYAAAS
jgi:hypothetical protein